MPLPTGSPRAQGTSGPQPRFWNRTSPASGGMAGPGAGARTGQGSRTGCAACLEASEERALHPAESDGHRKVPPPCGKRIYRKAPVFLQQFPLDFLFVLYQLVARLSEIPFRGLSSPDRPSCRQTGKAGQPDVRGFLRRASVDARDACRGTHVPRPHPRPHQHAGHQPLRLPDAGARRVPAQDPVAAAVRHGGCAAAGIRRGRRPAPGCAGGWTGPAPAACAAASRESTRRCGAAGCWRALDRARRQSPGPGGRHRVPFLPQRQLSEPPRQEPPQRAMDRSGMSGTFRWESGSRASRPRRGQSCGARATPPPAPAPCRRQASTHHDRPRVRRDA